MSKRKLNVSMMIEGMAFFLISVFGILFSIVNHKEVNVDWKLSPYLFPLFISILLLFLSIALLIDGFRQDPSAKKKQDIDFVKVAIFVVLCGAYYYIVGYIGFILTTMLFLVGMFILLGERKWWLILLLSVVSTMAIWGLFGKFLHVMLPTGKIFDVYAAEIRYRLLLIKYYFDLTMYYIVYYFNVIFKR